MTYYTALCSNNNLWVIDLNEKQNLIWDSWMNIFRQKLTKNYENLKEGS